MRNGVYAKSPSIPFRDANLARVRANHPTSGTDLGLYSVSFNNDLEADARSLNAFAEFRAEAARNNFKDFYEVFNPNLELGMTREQIGQFVNDNIIESLASVTRADRPQFLIVCFCTPLSCHGDLLLRLANASRDEPIAWWRRVTVRA